MAAIPLHDSSQQAAVRRLASMVVWLALWLAIPLAFAALLLRPEAAPDAPYWVLALGVFGVSLCAQILLRKGRANTALTLVLWGALALVLSQCLLTNALRTPLAVLLPVLVMLCAWLRSPRQTLLMALVVVLAISAMALLEARLWPQMPPRNTYDYWASHVFALALGCGLAMHAARHLRQAARERDAQLAELHRSERKFATFFALNPVPLSVTAHQDGRYLDVNPSWERSAGWSRAEALGRTSTELGLWPSADERNHWLQSFRDKGRSSSQPLRIRNRAGEIRYFLANAERLDFDGHDAIFAAYVDITDQRDALEALRQLNAELEQRVRERTEMLAQANTSLSDTVKHLQRTQDELVRAETMASLGALVAGVSHELNTPIGNALTVVTALQDQGGELGIQVADGSLTRSALNRFIEEQQQGCALTVSNLRRAAELVASFKQVAVDQTSERRRDFDLADALHDILNTLRPLLKHRPVQLHTALQAGLRMDSYPGPLGQVVSNLLHNALLHAFEEGQHGNIHIRCHALEAGQVCIEVSDDGAGIRAEHLPHIFDPFFTTRLGRGGSGLGLSIVYRLVTHLLGGSISVEAAPGEGACFRVLLPRQAPTLPPASDA